MKAFVNNRLSDKVTNKRNLRKKYLFQNTEENFLDGSQSGNFRIFEGWSSLGNVQAGSGYKLVQVPQGDRYVHWANSIRKTQKILTNGGRMNEWGVRMN